MDQKFEGMFSLGFQSLQLQLQSLLQECGGDRAIALLDTLSNLETAERNIILPIIMRALTKLTQGEQRLPVNDDVALKEFEEGLYRDILESMRQAAGGEVETATQSPKLSVLKGGKNKSPARNELISLCEVRKERKAKTTASLN